MTYVQVGSSEEQKDFDWKKHHQFYIEQWEEMHDNMDENNEPHMNLEFRRYQAWYQRATRCRLRVQWTEDDYADIESSDDEDTAYDQSTRAGRWVEAGPILDRVVSQLPYFSMLSCIPIHSVFEVSILVSGILIIQYNR